MLGKELLVPALLGLGMFAKNTEMDLANNTSMLLILFLLLKDKCNDKHHHYDGGHHHGDGIIALGGRAGRGYPSYGYPPRGRFAYYESHDNCCPPVNCCNPCNTPTPFGRFDDGFGCGCFNPCDPCGHRHHHHEHKRRRKEEHREKLAEEVAEEVEERLRPTLDRIKHCSCHHHRHSL